MGGTHEIVPDAAPVLEPRRASHVLFGDAGGLWGLPFPGFEPRRVVRPEVERVEKRDVRRRGILDDFLRL